MSEFPAVMPCECLYDELLSVYVPTDVVKEAIEVAFASTAEFMLRQYRAEFSRRDVANCRVVADKGNHGLKLAFVLLMLAQEQCHRDAILLNMPQHADLEQRRKAVVFYRVLSVAVRSLFETPYDETNSRVFVMAFLEICVVAWNCMSSSAMSMFCDRFSARCEGDVRSDGGGLFAPKELCPPLLNVGDICRDRGAVKTETPTYAVLVRTAATGGSLAQRRSLLDDLPDPGADGRRAIQSQEEKGQRIKFAVLKKK